MSSLGVQGTDDYPCKEKTDDEGSMGNPQRTGSFPHPVLRPKLLLNNNSINSNFPCNSPDNQSLADPGIHQQQSQRRKSHNLSPTYVKSPTSPRRSSVACGDSPHRLLQPCRPAPSPPLSACSPRDYLSSSLSGSPSTNPGNIANGDPIKRPVTPRALTPKPPVPVKPAHLKNLRSTLNSPAPLQSISPTPPAPSVNNLIESPSTTTLTTTQSNSTEPELTPGTKQSSSSSTTINSNCSQSSTKCLPEKASPPQTRKDRNPLSSDNSVDSTVSLSPESRRRSSRDLSGTINSFLHPQSTLEMITPNETSEEEFSDSRSIGSTNSFNVHNQTTDSVGHIPGEVIDSVDGKKAENHEPEEEGKKRLERKLFLVAQELTQTEEDFVNNMVLLLDFRDSIGSLVPEETVNSIFRYVPELHEYHKQLAEEFRNRINNWANNPKIADVLIIMGPFLKPHAPYTKEFTSMVNTLEESTKKYPGFADCLRDFERTDRCNKLLVRHYMHKPVQRLPQYKLILEKYQTYITEDHADYKDTKAAIQLVSKLADFANDFVRVGDSSSKLLKFQNSLVRSHEIIKPGRVLLKDGELDKLSRHEPQPRLFLLCNDCLIYLTPLQQGTVYKLNHEIPLEGMRVQVPDHQQFQNEFSIISPSRSMSLAAKTPSESAAWIEEIRKAIKDYETRRSTFNPNLIDGRPQSKTTLLGAEAPLWIPDTRVTMCQICSAEFTVTFRRHHCRACGKVVCNDCSSNKAPLSYLKFRAARVCDQCFPVLREQVTQTLNTSNRLSTLGSYNHNNNHLFHASGTEETIAEDRLDEDETTVHPCIPNGTIIFNHNNNTISPITPSSFDLDNLKAQFVRLNLRASGRRRSLPQRLKEVSADDKSCSISGYLAYKKIYKKNWKKAWFVVKEKVLYRFKESNDTAALQSLPILGYQIQLVTDGTVDASETGLIFQLSHPGQNTILFKTSTKESALSWIQEILVNTQL